MIEKSNSLRLSCEFFPAATKIGEKKLAEVRQALSFLNCEYYSVTYGAGGATRDQTIALVKTLCREAERAVMPHITCVASHKRAIASLLAQYQKLGIKHLMLLRGDMPSGIYQLGDIMSARDLVRLVRKQWGDSVHIVVAAYPETHPQAQTQQIDLVNFYEKCAAGANEAVTQYFFNGDAYLRFRDDVVKMGVSIPIVPGIMPITNYVRLARFSDNCGTEIPRWIRTRLESYQEDSASLLDFGADVVSQLCQRLVSEGVPGLHFYTMNRADALIEIAKRLGWYAL